MNQEQLTGGRTPDSNILIEYLAERLQSNGELPTDSNIIAMLAGLTSQEIKYIIEGIK